MKQELQLSLFGKFEATYNGRPLSGLETAKVQELLCFLLLNRRRVHHREILADLLWADQSTTQAKKYLRKVLWQLQKAVERPSRNIGQLLVIDSDWISLNFRSALWLDIDVFERGYQLIHGSDGRDLEATKAKVVESAVALYKGDLLEGYYQDWCVLERDRLQHMYLDMLDRLMRFSESQDDYEQGLAYGAEILRYDQARECTHREIMRLRYLVGDRTGALRQYDHCRAVLSSELGVQPGIRTHSLYLQVKADVLLAPTPPANGDQPSAGTPTADLATQFRQHRATLSQIRKQIEQEIAWLDSLLDSNS